MAQSQKKSVQKITLSSSRDIPFDKLLLSLAENIQRAPLHPLDQFRAFLALRAKGQSEEEIAANQFVSVAVVKQRLRLASVSPKLLDVYAEDGMICWGIGAIALLFTMPGTARAQDLTDNGAGLDATVRGPETSPVSRALQEAWWTGPIAASSPETLPRGHVLFEPYLFNVRSSGSDYAGSLTYILYGVTDTVTLGVIPTFGSARTHESRQPRRYDIGDLTLTAQYRFNRAKPGALIPTLAVVVQRTLPLGRFDRLGSDLDLGIGTGAQSTLIGAYAQRIDRLGNGRPLRTRLNMTYSFAPAVHLDGVSSYGTPDGFRGSARPGDVAVVDLSVEYSLTRKVVFAADLIYRATGPTSITSDGIAPPDRRLPATRAFSIAPAIEYSWSSSRGLLIGVRLTPKGKHVSASVTPVVAFNAVF